MGFICKCLSFLSATSAILGLSLCAYYNMTRCNRKAFIIWQKNYNISLFESVVTFAYNVDSTVYKCNITYNPLLRPMPYDLYYSEVNYARCCTSKRGNYEVGMYALIADSIIIYMTFAGTIFALFAYYSSYSRLDDLQTQNTIRIACVESNNLALGTRDNTKDYIIVVQP